jgi:hypothetical protein
LTKDGDYARSDARKAPALTPSDPGAPPRAAPSSGSAGGPRTFLFRAVGLHEAADIRSFAGFRQSPSGWSMEDKWFGTSHDDAVTFGRLIQRELPEPRPFVIAEVEVPASYLSFFHYNPHLDGVGPAYLVRKDQLPELNAVGRIIVHEAVYAVEQERRGDSAIHPR